MNTEKPTTQFSTELRLRRHYRIRELRALFGVHGSRVIEATSSFLETTNSRAKELA